MRLNEVIFRAALISELPVVVRLKIAMFFDAGLAYLLANNAYDLILNCYRNLYETKRAQHFLAESDGQVVACAGAFIKSDIPYCFYKEPQYGFIGDVYTVPEYRRRGLATKLSSLAIDWLKTQGIKSVRLLATVQGRSIYEKMGFISTGEMALQFTE